VIAEGRVRQCVVLARVLLAGELSMMSGVDKPVVTTSFKQFKDAQLLMDAAKYNDCKRLQDEIWSGVDVNSQDMTGCTVSNDGSDVFCTAKS
jgi:hypothetical protein